MKKFVLMIAVVSLLASVGPAQAKLIPEYQFVIGSDGYVEINEEYVYADTLVVVTNVDPTTTMPLWLELFDKKGELFWEGEFLDGGGPVAAVAPNGYGWITLAMIYNMENILQTKDPFGDDGGIKYYIRISGRHDPPSLKLVPIVEIKQVVYETRRTLPSSGSAIWQSQLFKSWTETALGGNKYATGIIWSGY
jgi:hypothetical protein